MRVTKHSKYIITIVILVILGIFIDFVFYVKNNFNIRGQTSLINQYFKLRDTDPADAKHALERLLQNDPTNLIAMRELGYWYIRQGDINSALKQFTLAHRVYPDDQRIALELGKLYILTKQYTQATSLLNEAAKTVDLHLKQQAQIALSQIPATASSATEKHFTVNAPGNLKILTIYTAAVGHPASQSKNLVSNTLGEITLVAKEPSVIIKPTLCQAQSTTNKLPTKQYFATKTLGNLQILTMMPPISTPKIEYIEKTPSITASNQTITSEKTISITNSSVVETKNKNIALIKSNERDELFNQYYALKKDHPQQAWKLLQKILKKYPNDIDALKEAGYTTLNAKDNISAYGYFKRAYEITRDPQLAMQLGYILVDLNRKRLAYYYFDLATNTKNTKDLIDAEMAKTNLTQAQMKLLPEPYYLDIFYDPFYYSRFKMVVEPLVIKVGKLINEKYQFKIYVSYQRTVDDRSSFIQQLPQIFEDNDSITALGAQINPIPTAPLTAFVEAGKAVDIVYQNRSRWRSDLRGGLAYYKDWGEKPTYTIEPVFSDKVVGDFYSDMIYFSRYRDIIGSVRLRQGIRVFKYETSSIDLYLKGFVVWDTAHQYYNNIVEWGPGIALTPSNRYNVVLHLEALQGHYIPVTSPSPNPYTSNYHNNLLLLDCYFRL